MRQRAAHHIIEAMQRSFLCGLGCLVLSASALAEQTTAPPTIPLPEHPRPDFERAEWLNLNGRWRFAFDAPNEGERAGWMNGALPATREILVPFSWGAPLSGIADSADIGWYARSITVPESWRGRRVFLVFGASDWRTTAWIDGRRVGEHQGGYTPFAFELTPHASIGEAQQLVVRVETPRTRQVEGTRVWKARGGVQTVSSSARRTPRRRSIHSRGDGRLAVDVRLREPAGERPQPEQRSRTE